MTAYFKAIFILEIFVGSLAISDEGGQAVDFGPWLSQDETLAFQVISPRLSWWSGAKECGKVGMRLPTWDELADNWRYLVGTTPINRRLADLQGCFLICPTSMWTSDEKDTKLAYDFSNSQPGVFDPRGAPKELRFPIVCVTTL